MPLTRRRFVASSSAAALQTRPARKPPNIVVLITDDQGFGDLSLHGNPHLSTPNLDRIGTEGVQFTQFQVCPVCSPTRSSLMTGRYNYRTGVVDTYLGRSMMDPGEVTAARYLNRAGYRTGIFGKWHLGDNYPLRATDHGFEEAVVCKGGGIGQPSDPPTTSYFNPILQHNNREERYQGYCTDVFFREAMSWIERHQRERFFCYLAPNAPHDPLTIADNYWKPYRDKGLDEATAKVYGMVQNIDENAGRLLDHLKKLRLDRDTVFIYLTDNGPQRQRFNAGMRGLKGTVYQGGIRVPSFWRWPGRWKPNKVDRIAAHIDILPTLLDLAHVEPKGPKMDGRSLVPLLTGEDAEIWTDRTLFTQWHRGDAPELFRACAARNQRYKLVDGKELYDLSADPAESNDLAAQRPEIAARLRQQTERWFKDVSATRGYAPVRIPVGTTHENPVTLTRQDWRGPRASWAPDGLGFWEIDVTSAGDYELTLRMPKLGAPADALVTVNGYQGRASAPAGAESVTLTGVRLPSGPARLEAELRSGNDSRGVHYVDVRKV